MREWWRNLPDGRKVAVGMGCLMVLTALYDPIGGGGIIVGMIMAFVFVGMWKNGK